MAKKANGSTPVTETPGPVVEQANAEERPQTSPFSEIKDLQHDNLPKYLSNWEETKKRLAAPFDPDDIKWLPQTVDYKEGTAIAAAYADPRVYTARMNEVIGLGFWQSRINRVEVAPFTKVIKAKLDYKNKDEQGNPKILTPESSHSAHKVGVVVEVGIWMGPTLGWVFLDSTGESDTADENWITTGEAQAYKRAMSKWGPGEYFYRFGKQSYGYDTRKAQWKEWPSVPEWAYPEHNCSQCGNEIQHATWKDKDGNAQSKHFWDVRRDTIVKYGVALCVPCATARRNAQTAAETKERLQ